MMGKTLYICLVEEQNDKESFYQVYWARALHAGEAIQKMLDAAGDNGLLNPIPRECDPCDAPNPEGEVEPSPDADVFWLTDLYCFPPEPRFVLPVGVIASWEEGGHRFAEILRGYTMVKHNDGLISIDVNAENDDLFPLYEKMIHLHQEYKVFWYILHGHWDDEGEDRFLVNNKLNTPDRIIGHLRDNRTNSVQNGFVTLTAYLEEGATNLNISDHKRIAVRTYSDAIAEGYSKMLEQSGYSRAAELISIDSEMRHWHYRVSGSMPKKQLEEMLKHSDFSDWKPDKKE